MILVDTALERRRQENDPVRVGLVGAGFMARGVALHLLSSVPGMRLVAMSNRTPSKAEQIYREAGVDNPARVGSVAQLEDAIGRDRCAVTDDALLLCQAGGIDAIIDATGSVEFGARVAMEAITHGKHLILVNAELDATLGPILKVHADRAGVIVTGADGDQPAATLNLCRFLRGTGMRPVLCGNIKGLHDPYRTPTTQESFARQWGQTPSMVTSFADGTKISFEQAITANATGMRVARRGMLGPTVPAGTPIEDVTHLYPLAELLEGNGIVDYVVGAVPGPGVFVLAVQADPQQRLYLKYVKMGDGPLYCFYTPYHLINLEVHNSVARAVIFHDAALAPLDGPQVDVVATAKRDLAVGEEIDGLGGFMTYGLAENSAVVETEELLPMGLAAGCVLRRDVAKDAVLTYGDVELPSDRLSDALRAEQDQLFGSRSPTAVTASAE